MKKGNFAMFVLSVAAINLYATDITISDQQSNAGAYNGQYWYGSGSYDSRGIGEDHEVEPGCVGSQVWDLEAFNLSGNNLGMVGGYDFKNGVYDDGKTWTGGDIFVGVGDAPVFGVANNNSGGGEAVVKNNFGYDYAIDLAFNSNGTGGTYNVYALNDASTVKVFFGQNSESNPWQYDAGGTLVTTGAFTYQTGLTDAKTGFTGDAELGAPSHNAISGIDLSFIGGGQQIWTHYTMECGNDDLMGHATLPVPEPGTLMLFGSGLIGLFGLGFFRRKK